MLSILIPVHNWPVAALVQALCDEMQHTEMPLEIICCDNGSDPVTAREQADALAHLSKVKYIIRSQAMSRSAIRNYLVQQARSRKLLFIDGDAGIPPADYLATYFKHYHEHVVAGGIAYQALAPADKQQQLRWYYGRKREALSITERVRNPYRVLTFFNLLIDKQLLLDYPLSEHITEYGHEDTLFALALKRNKVSVKVIDNPLIHEGLENGNIFLQKCRTAAASLARLCYQEPDLWKLRLPQIARNLKSKRLCGLYIKAFERMQPMCHNSLLSGKPSLKWLDAYKLWAFLKADAEEKQKQKNQSNQ